MKDLIEALTIFSKYTDAGHPVFCQEDIFCVRVDPSKVDESDLRKLEEYSFYADEDEPYFYSHHYGH